MRPLPLTVLVCFFLSLPAGLAEAAPDEAGSAPVSGFTLASNGTPACTIIVAEQPTPAARLASLDLQYHVMRMTGAELPIRNDKEQVTGPRILVGESEETRALGFRGSDFPPQEYIIAFRPDAILIGRDWEDTEANRNEFGGLSAAIPWPPRVTKSISGRPWACLSAYVEMELPGVYDDQGTCYAVYDFLERFCNVRWYGPNDTGILIPSCPTLTVQGTDIRRSPALKYRDALWSGNWPFMKGQWGPVTPPEIFLFWRRLRLGGEKWAGNHTFHKKTVETIFTNPAYQAEGKGRGSQLCYTNPQLVQDVAQLARDFFDGKNNAPEGWKAVGNYFALIPDDNSNYCRCDNCRKLVYSGRTMRTKQFSSGISATTSSPSSTPWQGGGQNSSRQIHRHARLLNYAYPPEGNGAQRLRGALPAHLHVRHPQGDSRE